MRSISLIVNFFQTLTATRRDIVSFKIIFLFSLYIPEIKAHRLIDRTLITDDKTVNADEKKISLQQRKLLNDFERCALRLGSAYLQVGGPTTRLEDKIVRLGNVYNIEAEVFATPSALIISAFDQKERFATTLKRIKEKDIDLNALFKIDSLLEQMIEKNITLRQGYHQVKESGFLNPIYPSSLVLICSFAIGFLISILEFSSVIAALISGILSLVLIMLIQPMMTLLSFTRIFFVFFGSLFCIFVSAIVSVNFKIPIESVFIGPLINMVPGLMLTTAVSELAEHNFVSGTVKLAQGLLVLLAIGTALFLGIDALDLMGYAGTQLDLNFERAANLGFLVNLFATFAIVTAFSIRFQTPAKYILFASISGVSGWATIYLIGTESNYVFPTFLSSLIVGLSSLGFARLFNIPSQVFSVPGIISLVPGVLSASLYTYSHIGVEFGNGNTPILKVSLITAAIVFGLITARFPYRIYRKVTGDSMIPND